MFSSIKNKISDYIINFLNKLIMKYGIHYINIFYDYRVVYLLSKYKKLKYYKAINKTLFYIFILLNVLSLYPLIYLF